MARSRMPRRSLSATEPRRRPLPCPRPDAPSTTVSSAAIDDDLDMPVALALLREILRAPLTDDERRWLVLDADVVLGLDLDRVWEDEPRAATGQAIPDEIQALADARAAARTERDWARADALRNELETLGWIVVDGPDGSRLERRGPEATG